MKVALCSVALFATASAFAPQTNTVRSNTALEAENTRRQAIAAASAAFLPAVANAAVGESPRFSVFGLIGDGTSYSEGAAYGSDQSKPVYSPYSVYSEMGKDSLYVQAGDAEFTARKQKVLVETRKRLELLPAYIEKKQWFNVRDELKRYMYETRGAVRGLAKTLDQKDAADAFFKAIEKTDISAALKKQDACAAAAKDSVAKLDAFTALL